MHTPDLWTLVKITNPAGESHMRIMGSWYGGFGGSNSWRLSSGCKEPLVVDSSIEWLQDSGSTYKVGFGNVGISGYSSSVLASLTDDAAKTDTTVEIIDALAYLASLGITQP